MTKSKITIKEAKLIKGIAEGKTKRQAAMDAYDVEKVETASVMASEALKKPNVQEALEIALRKHGIDIDSAVAPIGKALAAKKTYYEDGERIADEDDLEMQLKGSDRALKLMGIGRDNQAPSIHFHQHLEEKRAQYDF